MSLRQITKWRDRHYNADGLLLGASGLWVPGLETLGIERGSKLEAEILGLQPYNGNVVTDEGEAWILNVVFRNTDLTSFTGFELVLATNGSLVEASVFATITELTDGDGYAAKSVAQGTGGWTAPTGTTPTSITTPNAGTHDWTATAAWSAVEYACIVTDGMATNRLIALNALNSGSGRTLANGDTLSVDFDLQAGGA